MTGYIKAFKPELKMKDYEIYKGLYCSICKTLGKLYSPAAQLLLSYDFTFVSLMRLALAPDCAGFTKGRCCYNPSKKCLRCSEKNELERSADVAVIVSYYKLRDNIADSAFLKRLLLYPLLPLAALMHKKAARRQPMLEMAVKTAMLEQARLEKEREVPIDIAADPSAKALGAVLSQGYYEDDKQQLWRFGYLLGRWIYLIDAVDDLPQDIKKDSFNPFRAKFPTQAAAGSEEFRAYAAGVLNVTAGEVASVFEGMGFHRFRDIIDNIVYDGLNSVQNSVIYKGRCEKE